nr:lytic transglycosylase domain-containing protein [uncultured Desulfobacter sp.]
MRVSIVIIMVWLLSGFGSLWAPNTAFARLEIKKLDYAKAWKTYLADQSALEPVSEYPYEACFRQAAKRYDLPLTLLLAMARGESDFNARAGSSKSCYGIMQIQWPGTAGDLGFTAKEQLYDPCRNISAGAKYIRMMLDRYNGDLHRAVAAYNYGPGRISKTRGAPIPKGADWYSGYIYHHLQQVLAGAVKGKPSTAKKKKYTPGTKIPVILFHNPLRARDFMAYFQERAPNLKLDWFRTSLGETYIVLLTETKAEQDKSVQQMKKLGYHLKIDKAFQ